jgi:hypothetical protein
MHAMENATWELGVDEDSGHALMDVSLCRPENPEFQELQFFFYLPCYFQGETNM